MKKILVVTLSVLVCSLGLFAQAGSSSQSDDKTVASEGLFSRWLNIDAMSASYRWRSISDYDGFHLFDSGQERFLLDGGLKLDQAGNYTVNFHASTGRNFNWAYSDSLGDGFWELITPSRAFQSKAQLARKAAAVAADPVGAASYNRVSRGDEFYMRELYLSATPVKQFTVEFGGIGIERGLNSEITSYDDDGYMIGERLRIHDPEHLYFDQIAVTYGYMGDYFVPNLFDRGNRFSQSNYHQFLLLKKFNSHFRASADYTWQNGVQVMREAALVKMPETKVLDRARFELYQRMNDITLQGVTFTHNAGFAFTGSRSITKRFELEGGYASVDQHYSVFDNSRALDAYAFVFNGDAYGLGRRVFTRANLKLTPYFSCFGFYTHTIATDYYSKNKEGMNFGVSVDFKSLLNEKFGTGFGSSPSYR